jgi:hypothetical protein
LPTHLQLNSKWYGRWSKWTPCSISCTTQRYRLVCVMLYILYVYYNPNAVNGVIKYSS